MIELIPDLPANVVGAVARGRVTRDDYEDVLIPEVEEKMKRRHRVRFLLFVGPEFEEFTPGALVDDARIAVRNLGHWDKVAIVTDVPWLRAASRALSMFIPCPVKIYPNTELGIALDWVQH